MARSLPALAVGLLCAVAQPGEGAAARPTGEGTATALATLARVRAEARSGDPEAVQRRYEAARAIIDGLSEVTATPPCRRLHDALAAAARGSVLAAEAVDRLDEAARARSEGLVAAALTASTPARRLCPSGIRAMDPPAAAAPPPLAAPLAGEAFFGEVRLVVPRGTRVIELRWRGRTVLRRSAPPPGPTTLRLPEGTEQRRGTLEAVLELPGTTLHRRAAGVWLLPATGAASVPPERADPLLASRLASLGSRFGGYAGIYVSDLATGRAGEWNADARFPAASTVKIGVLAAALRRLGPRPERSPYLHDLRALAAWSSNLAANRLLDFLGEGIRARGQRVVEAALERLGAVRSTYPGPYRVGTSRTAAAGSEPPLVSGRITTARDLGRALARLHAAATGDALARRSSGLSVHQARIAIALLLDSQARGPNVGLFRPWLSRTTPVAQKHGWTSTTRHSVAVVYLRRGPLVISVLTYGTRLTPSDALQLGRSVVRVARG